MNIEDIKVGTKLVAAAHIAHVDGDDVVLEFTAPKKFRLVVELFDLLNAQLLTPVEEPEPYYVGDCQDDPDCPFFYIQNNNNEISYGLLEEVARFVYGTDYTADKETVRKRAETECARLNAEYRKEQK